MFSETKIIAERLKYLREATNHTVTELSIATNVSEEEYLNAEAGLVDFGFGFLHKAAKYFEIDISELLSGASPNLKGYQIIKSGDGLPLERRVGFKYLHLAPLFKERLAEPFMVTAKFREEEQNVPIPESSHNDQEFDLVISGKMKFVINGFTSILEAGDSIYYDANLPHGMIALDSDCTFLSVVIKKELILKPSNGAVLDKEVTPKPNNDIYNNFIKTEVDQHGLLKKIDFVEANNYNFGYDVVDAIADKTPEKLAMLWVSNQKEERRFTFGNLKLYSNQCANYFASLGIQKGDKVMLILKRHYQFWISMIALHKLGAIAIPATHLLCAHDLDYRFSAAGVSAIICTGTDGVSDEVDIAAATSPTLKTKIIVGKEKEGWHSYDDCYKYSANLDRIPTNKHDIMLMYFTSGTTGYPKIAAHDHTYSLGHFVTAKYWHNVQKDGLHFAISDTGWGKAVWGKLYGQWLAEAAIFTYDFDKFVADDLLRMFSKYQITTFCAPPTMYRFFIKEDLAKYNLSSLRHATIAGEALNPEVYEQFYKATGLKLMEGFGQTETTLSLANLVGMEPKPGSMGRPTPQYDIALVGVDGLEVTSGVVGEIVIKTDKGRPYGMFSCYFDDEAKTLNAWHNNMYHTGDMAWRDEDGYYWYVGRDDDLIKSSGYRIGPFEIESVLMELPYVLECAVTGVPHETRGQVVKATIILTDKEKGSEELKKEIQNYVKTHTAPYKYPRIIEFVDKLPKTISGKIIRKDIK